MAVNGGRWRSMGGQWRKPPRLAAGGELIPRGFGV
jgi:hypothetical protein